MSGEENYLRCCWFLSCDGCVAPYLVFHLVLEVLLWIKERCVDFIGNIVGFSARICDNTP